MLKKYIYSFIGLLIAAIGINITYSTNLGAAPIEEFNHQLANFLNLNTGLITFTTATTLLLISKFVTSTKFQFKGILGAFVLSLLLSLTQNLNYDLIISYFDNSNEFYSTLALILFHFLGAFLMGLGSVICINNRVIMSYNDAFIVQIRSIYLSKINVGLLKIIYDNIILIVVLILSLLITEFKFHIGSLILAFAIGSNVRFIQSHQKLFLEEFYNVTKVERTFINKIKKIFRPNK